MVSERKLLANRRNAKLSTGPKNTKSTKFNAQKHGLLSRAAIIQDGDAKEDPRELKSLVEVLREDLQPEGAMEEFLVDRIASCQWRLRRAQRAEVGEIRRVADSAEMDAKDSIVDRYDSALEREELSHVGGRSEHELSKTSHGIARMLGALDALGPLVAEQGSLTSDQLDDFINLYGIRRGSFGYALSISALVLGGLPAKTEEEPDTQRGVPSEVQELLKLILPVLIDKEIARLKNEAELVAEREKLERDAAVLSRHLPSEEALGKNMRYETAIDRQMYRALKELRELPPRDSAISRDGKQRCAIGYALLLWKIFRAACERRPATSPRPPPGDSLLDLQRGAKSQWWRHCLADGPATAGWPLRSPEQCE